MKTKTESEKKKQAIALKKSVPLYLLLAPAAILLFCFAYLPLGGLVMAFKNYSPSLGL